SRISFLLNRSTHAADHRTRRRERTPRRDGTCGVVGEESYERAGELDREVCGDAMRRQGVDCTDNAALRGSRLIGLMTRESPNRRVAGCQGAAVVRTAAVSERRKRAEQVRAIEAAAELVVAVTMRLGLRGLAGRLDRP